LNTDGLTLVNFEILESQESNLETTMKNSTASEFSHSSYSSLLFKSLTASDVEALLLPFYLGLDFEARRRRFGGGVSDDAIRQHCHKLNLDNAMVLVCSGKTGVIAAIELHPLGSDWEDTELALAECAKADRATIVAHLLQLAAFAAGKRGCATFVIPSCSSERDYIELLRGMGRVRMHADLLRLELGEYVSLHRR
jgi:hypothetical protein